MIFWPRRSGPCRRRGPFYTLVYTYIYSYTCHPIHQLVTPICKKKWFRSTYTNWTLQPNDNTYQVLGTTYWFDFIQRIWQTFLLEAADKWSAIPLLLCCNTRLAQLRRLRFQFQVKPSLPHYALLMRKNVPISSCTNIYFIPVSYNLTSELRSSGPAEAAHAGGGAPFTP